jgi:hypothetical protein
MNTSYKGANNMISHLEELYQQKERRVVGKAILISAMLLGLVAGINSCLDRKCYREIIALHQQISQNIQKIERTIQ